MAADLLPIFHPIAIRAYISKALPVPPNITLVTLPAKSPELNPVENIWQFMRDNWLSNCVFTSYDDIVDHFCFAWNKLIGQPWKIMSIGMRDWAYRFCSVRFGITFSEGELCKELRSGLGESDRMAASARGPSRPPGARSSDASIDEIERPRVIRIGVIREDLILSPAHMLAVV